MKLKGKVTIITGGATGIGRESAALFAAEGSSVIIGDINDEQGEIAARAINSRGGKAVYCHADVADTSQIKQLVRHAVDEFGRLDIYFHNAGVAGPGELENISEEAFDQAVAVNLRAGLFGAKFAAPEIARAGGGCILFTSSGLGLRPSPQAPTYSITKAGLVMLTRCLAVSLAPQKIRVNALCPGPVTGTPIWQSFINRVPGRDPQAYEAAAIGNRPVPRAGSVNEMAAAALFLVSPEMGYVNGVCLPVDGGGCAL